MEPIKEDTKERPRKIVKGMVKKHLRESLALQLHKDWDRLRVVTGPNGIGKSGTCTTLAMLTAWILRNDFHLDRSFEPERQVHWTGQAYRRACLALLPGDAVILDEPVEAAMKYKFMHKSNTDQTDFWYTNRDMRLSQFVADPTEDQLTPALHGRVWEEWRVVKRYDRHVVVNVKQLRDQSKVYDSPRHLFSASIPRPPIAMETRIKAHKRAFQERQAHGTMEEFDVFQAVVERMERDLALFD